MKINDAGSAYNFDTIDVDGKPEVQFKCLKRMVGERGFEPPNPLVPKQRKSAKVLIFQSM
jgi:hypothetical protein